MAPTRKNKTKRGITRKHSSTNNFKGVKIVNFEKEITIRFLEMLIMVKLYHWKTYSYATHKATDELYSSLNEHMDKFVEVLLGKVGNRMDLRNTKHLNLIDMNSPIEFKDKIVSFKQYLIGLTNHVAIKMMSNTDLLNIRDEILGDLNQLLYLLTFK
jgi:DNA-binding ferritin-like protein